MTKEFDGMTTKELVIESRKDIQIIKETMIANKTSLNWNWRITWLLLTFFTGSSISLIAFFITASSK